LIAFVTKKMEVPTIFCERNRKAVPNREMASANDCQNLDTSERDLLPATKYLRQNKNEDAIAE
jgi:hypothetical protein